MLKDLSAKLAEYQDNVKGVKGQHHATTRGKLTQGNVRLYIAK